jgi:hypothetical protein
MSGAALRLMLHQYGMQKKKPLMDTARWRTISAASVVVFWAMMSGRRPSYPL